MNIEDEYLTDIGLEVHIELNTKTKIFCGCASAFGGRPNSRVCPVCMGMPGTLPVLNEKVMESAVLVGLATNCSITSVFHFDRKNYFYPDNPQNYQISQLYSPICRNGYIEIKTGDEKEAAGATKKVRIRELHMEEDAGKLFHEDGKTLVDYNRAGVPLLEIVSMPDMHDAGEVLSYLENLRTQIRYLGVSDCKMQEGSMRVDVNLSVRKKGESTLGTRTEMKNLGSFRAVAAAIAHEKSRQVALIEEGGVVRQETRRWDEAAGESFSMRSKEDVNDYRYFPEPDLLPFVVTEEYIRECRDKLPEFRPAKTRRYKAEYSLPEGDIEILTRERPIAELFEETARLSHNPKQASNWMMGELQRLMRETGTDPEDIRITPQHLSSLIGMTERGEINFTVAKEVFGVMFDAGCDPEAYVREHGLLQISDTDALSEAARRVIEENPGPVSDYLGGKQKAIGFLVGQTMKAMGGKADATKIRQLLEQMLLSDPLP